jgi:hypothetical protein
MRFGLVLALVLTTSASLAGGARAEEAAPRSIWLECAAPKSWPTNRNTPVRLSCRVDTQAASGPAYWETVNPFTRNEPRGELLDPFAVEAPARSLDALDRTRAGRSRPVRATITPLLDPFDPPVELLDPFEPSRYEADVDDVPRSRL